MKASRIGTESDGPASTCGEIFSVEAQAVRLAHRVAVPVDQLVADEELAGTGPDDAGENLDQRGFAGTVIADQADDLIAADREIDAGERTDLAIGKPNPLGPHDMRVGRGRPCSSLDVMHHDSARQAPGRLRSGKPRSASAVSGHSGT
jgi:hypothetical protein